MNLLLWQLLLKWSYIYFQMLQDFLIMGDAISILKIFSHSFSVFRVLILLKFDYHVTVRIDIVCG